MNYRDEKKCAVCESTQNITLGQSCIGAVSYLYCERCRKEDYEPYGALTAMGMRFQHLTDEMKHIVVRNLIFHNKTIEEFDNDVKAFVESYT